MCAHLTIKTCNIVDCVFCLLMIRHGLHYTQCFLLPDTFQVVGIGCWRLRHRNYHELHPCLGTTLYAIHPAQLLHPTSPNPGLPALSP